jgi:hypothetical protein
MPGNSGSLSRAALFITVFPLSIGGVHSTIHLWYVATSARRLFIPEAVCAIIATVVGSCVASGALTIRVGQLPVLTAGFFASIGFGAGFYRFHLIRKNLFTSII